MPKRVSTYLSDHTLRFIGETPSMSGRLNQIIDRYAEIMRRDTNDLLKRFTDAELFAVRAACHSWFAEPAAAVPGGIRLEVLDADGSELAMSPAQVTALADKLASLTTAEEITLLEWAQS